MIQKCPAQWQSNSGGASLFDLNIPQVPAAFLVQTWAVVANWACGFCLDLIGILKLVRTVLTDRSDKYAQRHLPEQRHFGVFLLKIWLEKGGGDNRC